MSATYQPDVQGRHNRSFLIDLSRFWEILEYSSVGDSDSARRLFGDSLYSRQFTLGTEMSQTLPLPEPTRISPTPSQQGRRFSSHNSVISADGDLMVSGNGALDFSSDEFSMLAANFFTQGQDFLRGSNPEEFGNF